MHIQLLKEIDRENWQEWVLNNPDTTLYHRIEWKEVIEKSFGHRTFYFMAIEDGAIHGILPLVFINSMLFGRILCSMPFLNFGGVCADSPEAHQGLIDAARDLMYGRRADFVELRHLQPSPAELRRKEHKVSMTVALNPDPDFLWNNFKGKHRQSIRYAAKQGLEVVRGGREHLDDFFRIISRGWRDLGTPIYRVGFFEDILRSFGPSVEIYLVKHGGRTIAAAFNGLFRDTVEGMWTYSLREFAGMQTNYLLYWEMIKDACLRGYKRFHLGRSTNETGATFYKSKWNAQAHQLYWEYLLNEHRRPDLPELNVDNPKYRLAIAAWRKLPVELANLIGPFISRSLP